MSTQATWCWQEQPSRRRGRGTRLGTHVIGAWNRDTPTTWHTKAPDDGSNEMKKNDENRFTPCAARITRNLKQRIAIEIQGLPIVFPWDVARPSSTAPSSIDSPTMAHLHGWLQRVQMPIGTSEQHNTLDASTQWPKSRLPSSPHLYDILQAKVREALVFAADSSKPQSRRSSTNVEDKHDEPSQDDVYRVFLGQSNLGNSTHEKNSPEHISVLLKHPSTLSTSLRYDMPGDATRPGSARVRNPF